jgi:Protein of unknown function (DUF2505)
MMSAMKFSHEIKYAAGADDVYAMLGEQAFREQVCEASGTLAHTVQVTPSGTGMDVVVDRTMPADGIPSFATKFVGDKIQVVQNETWTSPTGADLEVTIPGKPGQFKGTVRLAERGGETTETVTGDIKVSIPLVGGKLESLIGDLLASALRTEGKVGAKWLAG